VLVSLAVLAAVAVAGCGDGGGGAGDPVTLRLLTYDSFPTGGTPLNDALDAFTATTGTEVEIVVAGDAGTMVSKAVLTAGNPEGDVMWGIDDALLSRALDAGVFERYESTELDALDPELVALAPGHEVTPVDAGYVCVNLDIAWFDERGLDPPTTFDDLADPAYRDLLVVEDPGASSPGLAFLLGTIEAFGDDGWRGEGWQAYWRDLRANGVEVVDSWTTAYYERFSGSSGDGPRPLVVSYASSPPVEVLFADPPRSDAPTASLPETCVRQVEFAGVLRGTEHEDEARELVDHLAGAALQSEIALTLFVHPARTDVALPELFTRHSQVPARTWQVPPAEIDAGREAWIDEWAQIVLR